jgi:hypothetical protein
MLKTAGQSSKYQKLGILIFNLLYLLTFLKFQKRAIFPPLSTLRRSIRIRRPVGVLIEQCAYVL